MHDALRPRKPGEQISIRQAITATARPLSLRAIEKRDAIRTAPKRSESNLGPSGETEVEFKVPPPSASLWRSGGSKFNLKNAHRGAAFAISCVKAGGFDFDYLRNRFLLAIFNS